jgi:hypothetical protein
MNNFTDLEIELAKKYISGDYTDVQFNYWIIQNKFSKKRMNHLVLPLAPLIVLSDAI